MTCICTRLQFSCLSRYTPHFDSSQNGSGTKQVRLADPLRFEQMAQLLKGITIQAVIKVRANPSWCKFAALQQGQIAKLIKDR